MRERQRKWVPVRGWEGLYEISDDGQVKSLPRRQVRHERLLKLRFLNKYLSCDLYRCGQRERLRVHVGVLEAFVGPRPLGLQACHNNGIHTDNRLSNLRWDTPRANTKDAIDHGKIPVGEKCRLAKLTEKEALEILASSGTHKNIAQRYGVCKATVSHIKNGRNWRHLQQRLAG